MWTLDFWKDTGERVLKTFLQSILAVFAAGGVDILSVDWVGALATAGTAAFISLLTSVASAIKDRDGDAPVTASLVKGVKYEARH